MFITIVTPTYNRAEKLPYLFRSLCQQTKKDFIWMIVDDGSSDETRKVIEDFKQSNSIFPIHYIYKKNGGKHSALNVAFREVTTELLFIVDSDDVLTLDAIETIEKDWATVKEKNLCGISYLRGYSETEVIGDEHPQNYAIDTFINVRYNQNVNGDKAEVWKTSCLKGLQFPEYEGEKFVSESIMWIKLAKKYKMLFVNKIIYITEYLEGGLSDTGKPLRFRSPKCMIEGSLETMSKHFTWKWRIKETLLYIVYSKFDGRGFKEMMRCPYKSLVMSCYLPGIALYHYWKKKYQLS